MFVTLPGVHRGRVSPRIEFAPDGGTDPGAETRSRPPLTAVGGWL